MKINAAKPKDNKEVNQSTIRGASFVCFKKVKRAKVKNNNRDTSINQVYIFFYIKSIFSRFYQKKMLQK